MSECSNHKAGQTGRQEGSGRAYRQYVKSAFQALHGCAYMARLASFDDIVNSATRNFSTLLP